MEIIVGTAGHIDHGKTALVRALTGTDADRLPEEKERGITIDIGFAELRIGDTHFGFVDVPGHERFVKNMLAGASGIDLVMLVIAADEGVMPQTREHFEICRLLGLKQGIIVLTKSDRVDDETLEFAKLEALELVESSFLEHAPIVAVSSVTGAGIDELMDLLALSAAGISRRDTDRITFLPIDRSFTVKGFGAVVTGTLASGEILEGDALELLPEGRRVRVRGLQTHGRKVERAEIGQRAAVNLAGIDHDDLSRGMVLSTPGILRPTQIFDSQIEMLKDAPRPMRSRQRVRVHIGTGEVLARVSAISETGEIAAGETGFVQFRLETPIASFLGQKFIIRSYSPATTIGGGQVLVTDAQKIRRKDLASRSESLNALFISRENQNEVARLMVERSGEIGVSIEDLQAVTGWNRERARDVLHLNVGSGSIVDVSGRYISAETFLDLRSRTLTAVADLHKHEPLAAGMSRETLRERVYKHLPISTFGAVIAALEIEGKITAGADMVSLSGHQSQLSPLEKNISDRLYRIYFEARLEPTKLDDVLRKIADVQPLEPRKLLQMLVENGLLVKVTEEYYFASAAIDELALAVKTWADTSADRLIDVARFKDIAGVSRKYAIPLLEYFDRTKVTVRAGDKRVVLR